MILAAGKGTRLQRRTEKTPKALVRAGGMSLLERLIGKLKAEGFTYIVINVHHLAGQITAFLEEHDNFGLDIRISEEREQLLETGGGIMHAAPLLQGDEPFLVHNVDILSDLNLRALYHAHLKNNTLATLAVRNRETSRYLLFDEKLRMRGWENKKTGEKIIPREYDAPLNPFAFSGIHVISPGIFKLFAESGSFSIIDTYLRLCPEHKIAGYLHDEGYWIDAGKPEGLAEADKLLSL